MDIQNIAALLIQQYYAQLQDLNYAISQRPEGERHPSTKEASIMCKLLNCIKALRKEMTLTEDEEVGTTTVATPNVTRAAATDTTATIHTAGVSLFAIPPTNTKPGRITKTNRTPPRSNKRKGR